MTLPKLVVFDLDGCVWDPEMWLLGRQYSKNNWFTEREDGNLMFEKKTKVVLMGYARQIFQELYSDKKWKDSIVCFASCCDIPEYAAECISKFRIFTAASELRRDVYLSELVPPNQRIIRKQHKGQMIQELMSRFGVASDESVIFFDNESHNLRAVKKLNPGCKTVYTPNGLQQELWEEAKKSY